MSKSTYMIILHIGNHIIRLPIFKRNFNIDRFVQQFNKRTNRSFPTHMYFVNRHDKLKFTSIRQSGRWSSIEVLVFMRHLLATLKMEARGSSHEIAIIRLRPFIEHLEERRSIEETKYLIPSNYHVPHRTYIVRDNLLYTHKDVDQTFKYLDVTQYVEDHVKIALYSETYSDYFTIFKCEDEEISHEWLILNGFNIYRKFDIKDFLPTNNHTSIMEL